MSFFKSLWYLGGLEPINSRLSAEEEAFGQSYGNRVASRKAFPSLGHKRAYSRRSAADALSGNSALSANSTCQAQGCG